MIGWSSTGLFPPSTDSVSSLRFVSSALDVLSNSH